MQLKGLRSARSKELRLGTIKEDVPGQGTIRAAHSLKTLRSEKSDFADCRNSTS